MNKVTQHHSHVVRDSHYLKTKAFFPLQILQADLLPLDEIQRRYNEPHKYILLAVSVFSRCTYAISLWSKRSEEVPKVFETP